MTHVRDYYRERTVPPRLPCHSERAYKALRLHVDEELSFREVSRRLGLSPGEGRRLVLQAAERFELHERAIAEGRQCARCLEARQGQRLYLRADLCDRLDRVALARGFADETAPGRWVTALEHLLDEGGY